jgi:hypothetical protein
LFDCVESACKEEKIRRKVKFLFDPNEQVRPGKDEKMESNRKIKIPLIAKLSIINP